MTGRSVPVRIRQLNSSNEESVISEALVQSQGGLLVYISISHLSATMTLKSRVHTHLALVIDCYPSMMFPLDVNDASVTVWPFREVVHIVRESELAH